MRRMGWDGLGGEGTGWEGFVEWCGEMGRGGRMVMDGEKRRGKEREEMGISRACVCMFDGSSLRVRRWKEGSDFRGVKLAWDTVAISAACSAQG